MAMTTAEKLLCDWQVNTGRRRIQVVLLLFRIAQHASEGYPPVIRRAASALYRSVALNLFSIDIPAHTRIGPRLRIHHGFGLVVNAASVIGSDVELRHNTTIGSKKSNVDCPVLEEGVSVGPQSILLGQIRIGERAQIGAGSVVLRDVEASTIVAGVPARQIGP